MWMHIHLHHQYKHAWTHVYPNIHYVYHTYTFTQETHLTPLRRELFFALAGLTYYFLTSSSVVALKALSTALLPLDAPYEGLSFAIVSCMGLLATILCASAEGACRCGAPRPRWPSPNCWGDLGASPKIEGLFRRHKVRVCRTENIC